MASRRAVKQSAQVGRYVQSVQVNINWAINARNVGGSEMYKNRIKQIKKDIGVPCYVMVTRFEGQFNDGTDSLSFAVYVGISDVYMNHEVGNNLDEVIITSILKAKVFLKGENK
jgi:hypothetical protein